MVVLLLHCSRKRPACHADCNKPRWKFPSRTKGRRSDLLGSGQNACRMMRIIPAFPLSSRAACGQVCLPLPLPSPPCPPRFPPSCGACGRASRELPAVTSAAAAFCRLVSFNFRLCAALAGRLCRRFGGFRGFLGCLLCFLRRLVRRNLFLRAADALGLHGRFGFFLLIRIRTTTGFASASSSEDAFS